MIHPALIDLYTVLPRKPKELWVSEIVFCLRKAYFSYIFNPTPPKNDSLLAGISLHKIIQDYYALQGYEIEKPLEVELKDGWKLIGRADAVKNDHILEEDASTSIEGETFGKCVFLRDEKGLYIRPRQIKGLMKETAMRCLNIRGARESRSRLPTTSRKSCRSTGSSRQTSTLGLWG